MPNLPVVGNSNLFGGMTQFGIKSGNPNSLGEWWNKMRNPKPQASNVLTLEDQLKLYDQQAQQWFNQMRGSYAEQLGVQTGQQLKGDVAALGRSASRAGWNTGGFSSGVAVQAEGQLRQKYGLEQVAQLAKMDQTISSIIAQGRLNVTLGHFDYVRQLSLMANEFEYQKRLIEFQVQLAKSNEKSGWSDFFSAVGSLLGTAGGIALGGLI